MAYTEEEQTNLELCLGVYREVLIPMEMEGKAS